MQALSAILFILAAAFAVFFLFLVFSDIAFYKLLITMVPVIIFGYYLNYDIRKMVGLINLKFQGERITLRYIQGRPRFWSRQNLDRNSLRFLQVG